MAEEKKKKYVCPSCGSESVGELGECCGAPRQPKEEGSEASARGHGCC